MGYNQSHKSDHAADGYHNAGQDRGSRNNNQFHFTGIHTQIFRHVIAQKQYVQLLREQENDHDYHNANHHHISQLAPGSSA